jgi:hypothetical protein
MIIWWCFPFNRGLSWRRFPDYVGWFVGLAIYFVASGVERHGKPDATLSPGSHWHIFMAIGAGLAAWGITLFINAVLGTPGKTNGVDKQV